MILVVARSKHLIDGPHQDTALVLKRVARVILTSPQEIVDKNINVRKRPFRKLASMRSGNWSSLLLLPEVPMGELVRACWLKIDNLPDQLWFP